MSTRRGTRAPTVIGIRPRHGLAGTVRAQADGGEPARNRHSRLRFSLVSLRVQRGRVGGRTLEGGGFTRASAARDARRGDRLGARDVAALAGVDLDPVARVDEQRHLDDGARLELRRLGHVRDRVALDARLGLGDLELDRGGERTPEGLPSTVSTCTSTTAA